MRVASARAFVAALALACAACASTTMKDSWFDPAARAAPFGKVLVIAVGADLAQQRIFEDIVAEKLRTAGVEGVQGYRFLPEGKATEEQMNAAVTRASADGLMLLRFKGVRTEIDVRPSMLHGAAVGHGWYGSYGGWYGSWYGASEVYQWRVATIETSVYDVTSKKLVWTGVTETYDPASFRRDAGRLADIIVGAIAAHKLTPKAVA